jgi:L-ribulose-5-phosphate 3-epimerase
MMQPNRRDVMKLGAALAATTAMSGVSLARQSDTSPKKRPIKKAVMWDMIKGGKSVRDRFDILKEAGFDGVEMNSPGGPPNDEIRKASEATGVLIEGMVDSVHWKQTLSDPRPETRDIALKALEQSLRDCKALGGTSVLLVPGVVNAEVSYDQCYQRSQEQIRKAIPLAEQLGVKIAIEDVWNNFLLSPMEAARYVDELNSPAVGWHMDLGNIVAYGYPEQWVKILGKRIVKLHVKEFSRKKMNDEGRGKGFNVKLGEGDINWKAVMQALDDVGYNTWMCAEVSGGGVKELKDIAQRMDKILAL